jgi:uncharacterized protein YozE (UPF0346 family)
VRSGTGLTFRQFLRECEGDESPVGDLAREVAQDSQFPEVNDQDALITYLQSRTDYEPVFKAARSAWGRYEATK